MGYWIHLGIDTGAGEVVDVLDLSCTSNVSPMWRDALGQPLYEFDGAPATEAAGPLTAGIERMEADPDRYRAMNPANGWGDAQGALEVLRQLRDGCVAHPKTTVRISR